MYVCTSTGPLLDQFRLDSGAIRARFRADSVPAPARNRAGTGSYLYCMCDRLYTLKRLSRDVGLLDLLLANTYRFFQYVGLLGHSVLKYFKTTIKPAIFLWCTWNYVT